MVFCAEMQPVPFMYALTKLNYIFLKIRDEQFPPKPNEFERIVFIGACNNSVTGTKLVSAMGVVKFKFGNINWCCNDKVEITASILAAAAKVWPVNAFVELNFGM